MKPMRSSKSDSSRRNFLQTAVTAGATAALYPALGAAREVTGETKSAPQEVKPFELDEITVAELQAAFTRRKKFDNHKGHKGTRRVVPSWTFVSFVVQVLCGCERIWPVVS